MNIIYTHDEVFRKIVSDSHHWKKTAYDFTDLDEALRRINGVFGGQNSSNTSKPAIREVILHNPALIVLWTDGTKTVVKAQNEPFDPEKGLAMAIAKKALGNKGNYYEVFRKIVSEPVIPTKIIRKNKTEKEAKE